MAGPLTTRKVQQNRWPSNTSGREVFGVFRRSEMRFIGDASKIQQIIDHWVLNGPTHELEEI
jgi:hypothetical protein